MIDVFAHFRTIAGVFGVQPDEEQNETSPEREHENEVQSAEPDRFEDSGN